jgi:hypothetical protein
MPATFTTPPNRLAKMVGSKGVSRSSAIQRAQANLVSMRDEGVAYINLNLDGLIAAFVAPSDDKAKQAETLYEFSDAISSTAKVFGMEDLGNAAYSLCQLLSDADPERGANRGAVKAHIDGMQILRKMSGAGDVEGANIILQNLSQLVSHFAPQRDDFPQE